MNRLLDIRYRNPTPLDDASGGYAVDDPWVNLHTGQCFKAKNVLFGRAVWQAVPLPAGLLLDLVPSAEVALATAKLRSAYTGYCLKAKRGTPEVDVGFDQQGVCDWGAADNFGLGTLGTAPTWYDQSGNARNVTKPSGFDAPVIPSEVRSSTGMRPVVFDYDTTTSKTEKHLEIPSSVSLPQNGFTVLAVLHSASSAQPRAPFELGTGISNTFWPVYDWRGLKYEGYGMGGTTGSFADIGSGMFADASANVMAIRTASGSIKLNINESKTSYTTPSALPSNAMLGGTLGGLGSNTGWHYGWEGGYYCFAAYARTLTDAEVETGMFALYRQFKIAPQVKDRLIVVSTSIGAGFGCENTMSYFLQMETSLDRPYRIFSHGIGGAVSADKITQLTEVLSMRQSGARNIFLYDIGINDPSASYTAAQMWANYQTFADAVHANNDKVICTTSLPRSGVMTVLDAYNALVRDGCGDMDGLCDYALDPVMGDVARLSDTTLRPDAIHPSNLGHAYLGSDTAKTINGL